MGESRVIVERLIEEGIAAKAHFQIWWTLRNLALPEFHGTMSDFSYVDFFHASNSGHYKLFFIALSKIYDRDNRVSSITYLKDVLRVEGCAPIVNYIEQQLAPLERLVCRILNIRNKTIAHNERVLSIEKVYEIHSVTPNEIRQLIEVSCDLINYVARALEIPNVIFESDRHERATLAMLDTLRRGKKLTV